MSGDTRQLVLATIRRAGEVDDPVQFTRARAAAEGLIKGLNNLELSEVCLAILDSYANALAYRNAAQHAATWMADQAAMAFEGLQAEVRTNFRQLQPIMQELMGRPTPEKIDWAIDAIEVVQDQHEQHLEAFQRYYFGLAVEREQQVDPIQQLNANENEGRFKKLEAHIDRILAHDEASAERLKSAVLQCASVIQTLVTGIRQVDQRLAALGVVA